MKKTILILHGWGLYGKKYVEIEHIFEKHGYHVLSPDLPGFGETPLHKRTMSVDDYVVFVKSYLDQKKVKKVCIIGHSFGGRVAAKFAVTYPEYVEKLILTGSPLIKTNLSLKKQCIAFFVKRGKKITRYLPSSIYKHMQWITYRVLGEWDYYKSKHLRQTFIKVTSEDIEPMLPKIKIQTLVVWGENDRFVPMKVGEKIAQRIPFSSFVCIPLKGHGIPYTDAKQFAKISLKFFS